MGAHRPFGRRRTTSRVVLAMLAALLLLVVAAATFADGGSSPSVSVAAPLPRVDIYGDSVPLMSARQIVAPLKGRVDVHLHMYGGTALCFWLPEMRRTAALHPAMVVIVFGGNYQRSHCAGPDHLGQQYEAAARTAIQIFSASRVVLANDPESRDNTIGNVEFDQAYRAAVAGHPNATVAYPALAVSPGHLFTATLPCLASELGTSDCRAGRITVRSADGIHVTAAGETRFGAAVAQLVVDAYPLRTGGA